MAHARSTIAAIATPGGYGGVGIVRVSGSKVKAIAEKLFNKKLKPRYAVYTDFLDQDQQIIDTGLAIYFPGPNSFTGEDVLELQAHGGPVILGLLLKRVIELGATHAKPGEFSERAFLNDKIDLVQAEAIADLIEAGTEQAARAATRSLQGAFSNQITTLNEKIIYLRTYVEAALDFPEEEIDFLNDGHVKAELDAILFTCENILATAKQGVILQEGIQVVLAGEPNAGKSSLLNALAQKDAAIVTDIPGTTRDVLREKINLDGVPLHIVDTAGLRESNDIIEQEGIKRAQQEIEKADIVLWVIDSALEHAESLDKSPLPPFFKGRLNLEKILRVYNKIDLLPPVIASVAKQPRRDAQLSAESGLLRFARNDRGYVHNDGYYGHNDGVYISTKTGEGFDQLKSKIFEKIGIKQIKADQISARARHLDILKKTKTLLNQGLFILEHSSAGELLAEHLREAHQLLGEITGTFTADDLLGEIFSKFCIGK